MPLPHPYTWGQQGDSALWMPALAGTRKPSTMRSMRSSLCGLSLACPVTRFRAFHAPHHPARGDPDSAAHRRSAFRTPLPKQVWAPAPESAVRPWEHGPSLRLRRWVTRPIREFNLRRLTMYQNRITLIGFVGKDATAVATKNANFTALSLATKSSYKDKTTGKYIDHTEWHRCIAWGKLADYAKTLKKGAHLAVEGEMRSRERTDKKTGQKERIWEVRVSSILKLDRAEKAAPEEAAGDDFNPEEEAA